MFALLKIMYHIFAGLILLFYLHLFPSLKETISKGYIVAVVFIFWHGLRRQIVSSPKLPFFSF